MKPRKQIRNKVFDLINGQTSLGNRVFLSRKVPLSKNDECDDGVILVYVDKESAVIWNQSPKEYKKTLSLTIAIVKSLNPDEIEAIEDQLETVAQEIEKILDKNDTLDRLCSECDFQSYEFITNEDGEFKEGAIKLAYSITYYEEAGLEEVDLQNFNQSNVVIDHNDHADFNFEVVHQV